MALPPGHEPLIAHSLMSIPPSCPFHPHVCAIGHMFCYPADAGNSALECSACRGAREGMIMRIAQVAPLHLAVPPKGYGGTERVIAELTDALVKRGHDVTLFASGDSRTRAH